jgi:hypothetical protein
MTQRLITAHICFAPIGRFGLRHIFTFDIASVKTSYMRGTLGEINSSYNLKCGPSMAHINKEIIFYEKP